MSTPADRRLREVIGLHFDPARGTPYWLARQRELGLDARTAIRTVADLERLGPFDLGALRDRPLEEFVPRALWAARADLILAETGATSGRPLRTVFTAAEFAAAFGAPFVAASRFRGFPHRGSWLFVGPSGPHVIAKAARLLARLHDALEPFCIDLDPRWARAQEPGSLGDALYRDHLIDQALDVVERERPDVLFTTPPLLLRLGEAMTGAQRRRIRGVHLGGMAVEPAAYRWIRESFDRAVVLPGYGNSLFGLLTEVEEPLPEAEPHLDYYFLPGRMQVQVVDEGDLEAGALRAAEPGACGRVVFSRFDESCLLPNVVERDRAVAVRASERLVTLGFHPQGVRDPGVAAAVAAARGVY